MLHPCRLALAALAAASALDLALALPTAADDAVPVRVWVGGQEVRSRVHPVHDGSRTYVPLEVAAAVGLAAVVDEKKKTVALTGDAPQERTQLRLHRQAGTPMILLEELAAFVDAEIRGPAAGGKNGASRPAKPGDPVYLLARVREARLESGALRIETSFPVPMRPGTLEDAEPPRDYVDCIGAAPAPSFSAAPVPEGEKRVRALSLETPRPEVVRVVIQFHAACGPAEEALGEAGAGTAAPPLMPDEFLRRLQANYPKLIGADAERRAAQAKRLEKAGAFDPVLVGGTGISQFPDADKPGNLKSFGTSDLGVEFLTPYGVKFFGGGRLYQGAVKSPLSPTGDAGEYLVGVKLPLLQGRGINEKAAALRQARLGVPLADADFDDFRLDVLLRGASDYWNWVAAGRRVKVAVGLLELARIRAKAVKDRADAGDLPLIDVVEANQEVQRREEGLRKAERDFQKEAFKLSLYLWEDDGSAGPIPTLAQLPPAEEPDGLLPEQAVQEGRSLALERRPELKALETLRRINRVDLDLARNLRLPQVDLALSPGVDTGFGGAGGTFKGGISLGLPLRQRTADGLVDQARLKQQKIETDLQLGRQQVLVEVEDAVSAVNLAYQRYQAAAEELSLAQRLEQGERDRFDLGDSTLFLVNQRERATAEAAVKVISLQAEYEQAVALFRAVTTQL